MRFISAQRSGSPAPSSHAPFGPFRGDKWSVAGGVISLAALLFGGPLLKQVDDMGVRFILIAVLIGVLSAGLVLMYYQGPDQRG